MKTFRAFLIPALFVLTIISQGCIRVPQASVTLSEELTTLINSAKSAHLSLLDEYISSRKKEIDQFINDKWVPFFMEDFMKKSHILDSIEKASTLKKKGDLMVLFSQAALEEISKRRSSMMDVYDQLDIMLRNRITAHYNDILTINLALTAHLRSAANVNTTRENLMKELKVDTKNLIPIDKINPILEKVISFDASDEKLHFLAKELAEILKNKP